MSNVIQIILLLGILYLLIKERSIKPSAASSTEAAPSAVRIVLDSCALIDGRILELVNSGFISAELVVPQFIISELQKLADGSDAQKRERARFGLDMVTRLQAAAGDMVIIDRHNFDDIPATDDKLVALAKAEAMMLYTTDYNLSKVAGIEGVKVLNVNELAQRLRPTALPGEKKTIQILQKGSNRDQGVGYLDDGTMIVVDNGGKLIGQIAEVEVTRMHQTVAGKMIFAKVLHPPKQVVKKQLSVASKTPVQPVLKRFRRSRPD